MSTRNVILVGLPGSGKTSTGHLLANKMKAHFVDTDSLIESGTGQSIEEIFATRTETYFRLLESALVRLLGFQYLSEGDSDSHVDKVFESVVPGLPKPDQCDSEESKNLELQLKAQISKMSSMLPNPTDSKVVNAEREAIIVSTGGGMFIPADNRETLKKMGTTVYIECQPEVISERLTVPLQMAEETESRRATVDGATPVRPLLESNQLDKGSNLENRKIKLEMRLKELLESRKSAYELADIKIDGSEMETEELVAKIEEILEARKQG